MWKLVLTILIQVSICKSQSDKDLFLLKADGFLEVGSSGIADYILELSLLEEDDSIKKHLTTFYFVGVSKASKLSASELEKGVHPSFLLNDYKSFYGNFTEKEYWINSEGERLTYNLNSRYNKIFILEKINGVWLKTEVSQADVILD